MNPSVILALIADLYSQINALMEENKQLKDRLHRSDETVNGPPSGA